MNIVMSDRLRKLPPYLFAEIDAAKERVRKSGKDIISLGIGDPDQPTPDHIINSMASAIRNPHHHQYPSYEGMKTYRQAVAAWYQSRFNVTLDADREVLSLIGSKEGIAHIHIAFVNPGDVVLEPDPAYPVYHIGTVFTDGVSHAMPLLETNRFLPDLSVIPSEVARRAKLMFINYPNNPTGALADLDFYRQVVEFARSYDIIVCADTAYSEIFDQTPPPSFLNAEGARDVGVEFHSLSKTYNMTGWRIGFVVGNADVIAGLGKVKTNIDSGIFQAVQEAGITALSSDQGCIAASRAMYRGRRNVVQDGLRRLGYSYFSTDATFYVWVHVPNNMDASPAVPPCLSASGGSAEARPAGRGAKQFCLRVLEETGVVVTPGTGFGAAGEGYFRIALTVDEARLAEALRRFAGLKW